MRTAIGLLGRICFFIGLLYIVGDAVLFSWNDGDYLTAIIKLSFFPLTYFVWPFYSGLWWILGGSLVGYWVSTFVGGMPPVDQR